MDGKKHSKRSADNGKINEKYVSIHVMCQNVLFKNTWKCTQIYCLKRSISRYILEIINHTI